MKTRPRSRRPEVGDSSALGAPCLASAPQMALGLVRYLGKMRGAKPASKGRVSLSDILWSWIGALLGIGALVWVNQQFFEGSDLTLVIGSLGASAVLLYGAPGSPLAQPRNLIGGHLISALVGVSAWQLLGDLPWLAAGVAVATAIALMQASRTLHPPGGATALIAVMGSSQIHALGFVYCLVPAFLGPLILLAVALVVNNIPAARRYPQHWW